MRAIVGLGNPGPEYADTRHNLGFWIVDSLATRWKAGRWLRSGARSETRAVVDGREVTLLKPMTWMNRSGIAVRGLRDSLACEPDEILVCYDELALPLGKIRLRARGSHGGHNGMRSIIDRLGTSEFPRLRVGIAPESGVVDDGSDFVLSPFTRAERPLAEEAAIRAADAVDCAVAEDLLTAMNRFNPEPS
ncbi:MAG TPA: aminoacyl-tRNA hydrolase [Gemmatimonadota bacterium]|nr:aminoacyl-tRNA hydrolase [Gemmatimonadota bacterium]